jgi:hypothetical protein
MTPSSFLEQDIDEHDITSQSVSSPRKYIQGASYVLSPGRLGNTLSRDQTMQVSHQNSSTMQSIKQEIGSTKSSKVYFTSSYSPSRGNTGDATNAQKYFMGIGDDYIGNEIGKEEIRVIRPKPLAELNQIQKRLSSDCV